MRAKVIPAGTCYIVVAVSFVLACPSLGDTVVLGPAKDNTLYESPTGALSNGAGESLFSGRTSQPSNSRRRALVAFDVAGNVPAGAVILSVTVATMAPQGSSPPTTIALHKVLADWGEGASDAGIPGGQGTDAAFGDATWLHTFFDTEFWTAAGGDFASTASASAAVKAPGPVTWPSTAALLADVQGWLDAPATNFGWVLVGDESEGGTAVSFASREAGLSADRPILTIEFTPDTVPAVSRWGMAVMALTLVTVFTLMVRRARVLR